MKHAHIPTIEELMSPDSILKDVNIYTFTRLSYQDKTIEVDLYPKLLDSGARKPQELWADYTENGFTVPDAEILYQCLLRAYQLRSSPQYKKIVRSFRTALHKIFGEKIQFIHTLTSIEYGDNLEATVSTIGPLPKKPVKTIMPEFKGKGRDYSILSLADMDDIGKTATYRTIPEEAKQILQEILGKDYDKAGQVFKYFTTPYNKSLTKCVNFSTPFTYLRRHEPHGVIMGSDINDFVIDTCSDPKTLEEPTIGVRIR